MGEGEREGEGQSDGEVAREGKAGRVNRPRDIVALARGDGWIVVAKPPKVITHRNWAHRHERAAVQRARDLVRGRVYPIHRLDRAASGCLLLATHRARAGELQAALVEGEKQYLAFVRGDLPIDGPTRVENPMKDSRGVLREAASVVEKLGGSVDPRCSLLLVRPETGRFHQVRRHVRDLHHPIIGDTDHGDSRINRWWREERGFGRLGLHAHRLSLRLPGGEEIEATCPLFADHHAVFTTLPWWEAAVARLPALALPPLRTNGRGWAPGPGAADAAARGFGLPADDALVLPDPGPLDANLGDEDVLDADLAAVVDLDALEELA